MREVQTGVWHWEAPHPEWLQSEGGPDGWGPKVSSYAIDVGERLLFVDPLAVPGELEALAAGRETAIVLTCPWHARDAPTLAKRLGAPIYQPPPDEGADQPPLGQVFRAGERLPVGVEAFPGPEPNDLVLWVEARRALVVGDTLVDQSRGLEIPAAWLAKLPQPVTREEVVARLRPLLELPVELVLPTHGQPTDRAALERALAAPRPGGAR